MLKIDIIVEKLKKSGKQSFEKIWQDSKNVLKKELDLENADEIRFKNDVYTSMLKNEKLIMVGDNEWDLRENYNLKEINDLTKYFVISEVDIDSGEIEENSATSEINFESNVDNTEEIAFKKDVVKSTISDEKLDDELEFENE